MKAIGAKAIAAALCANRTLETIDLSGNYFGCKTDDNAWESASELLAFGLQARYAVFVASVVASLKYRPRQGKAGKHRAPWLPEGDGHEQITIGAPILPSHPRL